MEFKKAVKTKQWLRLAIDGISGSGKTYTALATADGMAEAMKGKIALIDSEHGSASLYADRFIFDTLDLEEFQIENYIEALGAAAKAGYEIVIIDSTSHAWDALVERVERIAHQKFNGNTFRAWAEGTPLQKKLIEAMLSYPGHVIVTCRSKTEYSVDKDDKGKTTVKKVGTAAVQRQGFEYEFTMAMTMDSNHVGMVTKDRTGKFQDKFIDKPGKKFGEQLIAWLNEGAAPPPPSTDQQLKETMAEIGSLLDSEDFGKRVFTIAEKDKVRDTIKEKLTSISKDRPDLKLAFVSKLLEEQKALLHQRLDGDSGDAEPAPENQNTTTETPAPAEGTPTAPPATEKTETQEQAATAEAPAVQTGETQPPAAADDGFKDDIPWEGDGEKPGKGKAGKPKSLKEEFQKAVQGQANAAPGNETAVTSEQLDIF